MVEQILIFLYQGCAEFEVTVACWQIAESEKYETVMIAYDYEPISTNSGFSMNLDKLVSDIQTVEDVAGIIIPGGSLLDLRVELQDLLVKLNKNGKLLAAICAGPQYLAASGVLGSHSFTTSRTHELYLEKNEPDPFDWKNFRDIRVNVDENFITAKGFAFSDFALAIWEYLGLITSPDEQDEWNTKFFKT